MLLKTYVSARFSSPGRLGGPFRGLRTKSVAQPTSAPVAAPCSHGVACLCNSLFPGLFSLQRLVGRLAFSTSFEGGYLNGGSN